MNIKIDSRKIKQNDTFIAVRGVEDDGHKYIEKAIENGATKIIAEEGNYSVETIIVDNTREYLQKYLEDNYLEKIKKIKKIGVTGTNGKTTSCYLTYQLLKLLGKKAAYIGTIGFYIDEKIKDINNTTPDIYDLYEMFLECLNQNVEYVVMEVSSHSLAMNRVKNIEFEYAGFTNLTRDHMDFHITEENYINAKKQLFFQTKNFKFINGDDKAYKEFVVNDNNILYGFGSHNDLVIKNYNLNIDNSKFEFEYENKIYNVETNLVGKYNIYNLVLSLLLVNKVGFTIKEILKYSKEIIAPPGRTESIKYKNNLIIIDFAHTPDAMLNIIENTNLYKQNKVYTIVGCGGDRDKTKRPIMGDIATNLSDYVVFTNDNPRTEDEKQIMNDIVSGLKKTNYEVIYDRKEAIKKGIELLKENDILLILGKGHETYQIIGKEKIHFSDTEEVLNYIKGE